MHRLQALWSTGSCHYNALLCASCFMRYHMQAPAREHTLPAGVRLSEPVFYPPSYHPLLAQCMKQQHYKVQPALCGQVAASIPNARRVFVDFGFCFLCMSIA